MNEQQRQHLNELRDNHLRRLRVLELQAASYGLAAPPHILIEIDDIRGNIKTVEAQLADLDQPRQGTSRTSALVVTVLFLSADPTDASYLRLGTELREIQEKLQLAKQRERFELHQRMSVRPADISQALLDVEPGIVHFSGHGTTTGA